MGVPHGVRQNHQGQEPHGRHGRKGSGRHNNPPAVFPSEQYQAPRSWAERAYPKLIYFNEVDRGGHFAAWEEPELFSAELRAGFRSLRN